MNTKFGIYLNDKLIIYYDNPLKAYNAATLAYKETGVFHEVKKVI